MDLLLRCRFERDGTEYGGELAVSYESFHTVGELAAALGAFYFVAAEGDEERALVLWADRTGRRLNSALTLREAGIVNGDSLLLVPKDAERDPERWQRLSKPPTSALSGVELNAVAGPDAGHFEVLKPGTYSIGRNSGPNTVTVTGASCEPKHAMLQVTKENKVLISDLGSKAGTFLNEKRIVGDVEVQPNDLLRVGTETTLTFSPVTANQQTSDHLGQIPFNRTPYQQPLIKERKVDPLPAPPRPPTPNRLALATAFLPAIGGIVMAIAFNRLIFLLMVFLTPLVMVASHFEGKHFGRRTYRQDKKDYLEKAEKYLEALDVAVEEEQAQRLRAAPSLNVLVRRALFRQVHLWERGRDAGDFMSVRLGIGRLPSLVEGQVSTGGDEVERDRIVEEIELRKYIEGVPICVDLDNDSILGLFGDVQQVTEMTASLVSQIACLHSPEDVVFLAALADENSRHFDWLKWLPHLRSAASPVEGRQLVIGPEEGRDLVVRVLQTIASRHENKRGEGARPVQVVLLLSEAAGIDPVATSRLLDAVPGAGVSIIWLGREEAALPRQCTSVLHCARSERSLLKFTDPEKEAIALFTEGLTPGKARSVALFLTPLRDVSAAGGTAAMPTFVSLFHLDGTRAPTADDLKRRWERGNTYRVLSQLGQSINGVFEIDLVADGPHALVAGTSGAGKSELLQTMVASIALNHSPQRVNFLFIDYKGGAAFAQFAELPHAVGFVTNLNEQLSVRALISLRAELKYRQTVLEGKAKDLEELTRKFPAESIPSLVIVVDEFATLVKEIPDFVAGIVDIAQRGRSLGIHLVLATQRPTGAVNDNILANTNLRIALRVVDSSDSMNIINAPDAAAIPQPLRGRAYARRGPAELIPFQSAYANAPVADEIDSQIEIAEFPLTGVVRKRAVKKNDAGEDEVTELMHAVELAKQLHARTGLTVRHPWLSPLPELLTVDETILAMSESNAAAVARDPGRYAILGMLDDPEDQVQSPVIIDLERTGGMLIFGTGGAGKSTAIRSIAATAATLGSPEQVQIAVLDFGGRTMSAVGDLPHCRVVTSGDDVEETTRLLALLNDEVNKRRDTLMALRAATLSEHVDAGNAMPFPRLLVFLDNTIGFTSAFERVDNGAWVDLFQQLVASGRQVGLHFILTADRRNSVPNRLFGLISSRFVLRMADADEMSVLGVPAKVAKTAELCAGRGFLDAREVQVPSVSRDATGPAQANALNALAQELAATNSSVAPPLPMLPEVLDASLLPPAEEMVIPIGVADMTGLPMSVDLRQCHFLIAGPSASGRTSAAALIALKLRAANPNIPLFALGSPSSDLRRFNFWEESSFKRGGYIDLIEKLADQIEASLDDEATGDVEAVLFVDSADDMGTYEIQEALARLTRQDAVRIVAITTPYGAASAHVGWLRDVTRSKRSLFFSPQTRSEADIVSGQQIQLRPGQSFPAGRGVLMDERSYKLIQVGLPHLEASLGEVSPSPISNEANS